MRRRLDRIMAHIFRLLENAMDKMIPVTAIETDPETVLSADLNAYHFFDRETIEYLDEETIQLLIEDKIATGG
jgi:hypothetical protein